MRRGQGTVGRGSGPRATGRRPVTLRARTGAASPAVVALAAATLGVATSMAPRLPQQQDPTPHSDARLISETASIEAGQPFTLGLHITLDEGWHTYWRNAGDAGNGTVMTWSLPEGFTVDSLQYPRPERIPYPPLMNYGYNDEVVLLARVTPPADLEPGRTVPISARADFLVCEDICIPASADVSIELAVRSEDAGGGGVAGGGAAGDGATATRAADARDGHAAVEPRLIARYRDQLPVESEAWTVRAARTDSGFVLGARPPEGWEGELGGAYFFPYDATTLSHTAEQPAGTRDGELRLRLTESEYILDEPERLEGILTLPATSGFDDAGHRALVVSAAVEGGPDGAPVAWAGEAVTPLAAPAGADGAGGQAAAAARAGAAGGLSLVVALLFALVGGLILNLMPCVFPILSLKALGFASRGGDRRGMRLDGIAFGAGVVLTFLLVAGVLIAVRAGGSDVGWGFQLQSPTVVAFLAALMFGIGLWLAGVVELGASLTRLGGYGQGEGQRSAFLTGVLATIVATPCTAPFMGAAIGAALIRPAAESLAIFAALGVGMAAPYVILSFWPALAQRLPRPGRWMETFKQVLAFPMFAVAIWLVWVFGLQVGIGGAARLLFGLLLLAMAAWLVGRWPATAITGRMRAVTRGLAVAAAVVALLAAAAAVRSAEPLPTGPGGGPADAVVWEPYSEAAVEQYRAAGRPVFVDFTAAWCISCQVNERVALETAAVRRAFRDHDVALLKADWTRRDPAITRALASFGRVGVPLYVLYPADPQAEPRVLPELLTQGIVLDALADMAAPTASQQQARTVSEP